MKKLLRKIVVEIYEETVPTVVDTNELKKEIVKTVSQKIKNDELDLVRAAAKRRYNEVEDYYTNPNLLKEKKDGNNKTN